MDTASDAGAITPIFFLVSLTILVLFWWSVVRIIRKAGYRGWWSLVLLIPLVNIVFLWFFAFSGWPSHKPTRTDRNGAGVEPPGEAIGDLKLVEKLFGDNEEITWLEDTRWSYTRLTLNRDGRVDWKDEDKYDHDTTYFSGTYTLVGTETEFTVIGQGEARSYYDRYKDTQSRHHNNGVTQRFESSRFTGENFTMTRK